MRHSWLRDFARRVFGTSRRRKGTITRRKPDRQPAVEMLEIRLVPTTYTVTSAADSGANTLRSLISLSSAGDTIDFSSTLAGQTITLTTGELLISHNLTITGLGASQLSVSGDSSSRVFQIDASVTASISGLTITDGNVSGAGSQGGGVSNSGTLTLTDCTISGNSASFEGGGIQTNGSLTLTDCLISGNQATSGGSGGGINAQGSGPLIAVNTTISGNSATFAGGGMAANGTVSLTNCTISGNTSPAAGGIDEYSSTMTLTNCTVSGNQATNGDGGGVYMRFGSLDLTDTTISANTANAGGGISNTTGTGSLTLENTIVSANTATTSPDVVGTINTDNGYNLLGTALSGTTSGTGDVFSDTPQLGPLGNYGGPTQTMLPTAGSPAIGAGNNTGGPATDQRGFARAAGTGGDIGADEGTLSTVVNTQDSGAGSLRQAVANSNAGPGSSVIQFAVALSGQTITLTTGPLTLTNTTGTQTIAGPAAGVTISGNNASRVFQVDASVTASISGLTITDGHVSGVGGGLYDLGTTTLANCTISGNTASTNGGGAYSQGSSVMLTLTNCTISGNTAHNGGGLYNTRNATLTLTNCTISGNNAAFNSGLVNGNSGSTSLAGTATLTNCTISGNTATSNGGGMGNTGAAMLTNCTISGNSAGASASGGGLFDTGEPSSTLTLTNCTVSDNSAGASGGGLYTDDTVTLDNTIDAGNTAATDPDVAGRDSYGYNGSYNLIGNGNGLTGNGNISNGVNHNQVGTSGSPINALLASLGNYGGPTQTMALLPGSPALGAGNPSAAGLPATDQRGFARVVSSKVDIGAFQTQAAPFAVNTADDTATGAEPAGELSLRNAITLADALAPAGGASISFNIPTSDAGYNPATGLYTIAAAAALPTVSVPTTIDGTTQLDFMASPVIELDGASAGAGVTGLTITAGNSTVKGLVIDHFSGDGLDLTTNGGDLVQGNYIGTNAAGTAAAANGHNGITITSSANTVGGTTAAARNVISGNANYGVEITGSGTSANLVEGNYVGTDQGGTVAVPNGGTPAVPNVGTGVAINDGATDNTVGGTAAGAGNLLSGNDAEGVDISGSGASGNVVEGNLIGTDMSGTLPLGNLGSGVGIFDGASGNTIGGTAAGAGNVISANGIEGVWVHGAGSSGNLIAGNLVGTNQGGTAALANAQSGVVFSNGTTNNTVGGTTATARNIISGNTNYGVEIIQSGTSGNVVEGNYIGTEFNGTAPLGNMADGVYIALGATGNTIGGTTATPGTGAGNVVSANGNAASFLGGVYLTGAGTSGNVVAGNLIGTDRTGTLPLGNKWDGVGLDGGATGNTIGGTVPGDGNVIAANAADGVEIHDAVTTDNLIAGNFIGTNPSGAALGNTLAGVSLRLGTTGNTIGGTTALARNVISDNGTAGVFITNSGTSGNVVEGDYIGTDPTGTVALGNTLSGVTITSGADGNTVGGATAAARNVISANGNDGVVVSGSTGNVIQGNYVGTDVTGAAPLGNALEGVTVQFSANGTQVTGNVVSANDQNGVDVDQADNTLIQDNDVGTNATGTAGLGNGGRGIFVEGSITFTVTGTVITGNLVSDNGTGSTKASGVRLEYDAGSLIQGNKIGTDVTGTLSLGNGVDGLRLIVSTNDTVGGTAAGAGNVISANAEYGLDLNSATGTVVQGNDIGTDASGTFALPNGTAGHGFGGIVIDSGLVSTSGSVGNTIGGTAAGAHNLIAGNDGDGIDVVNGSTPSSGNVIEGNYVGVAAAGTGLIPGTVAWFPGDGNANDVVGGDNGTIHGGVTFAPGEVGQAFDFPGNTGDYVDVPNSAALQPANAISVDFWVKGLPPAGNTYLLAQGPANNANASYAFYTLSGGLQFYVNTGDGIVLSPSAPAALLWDDNWHHIVGTYDGTTVRLYVDGAQVGTGTLASGPISYAATPGQTLTSDLFIGNYPLTTTFPNGNFPFKGELDEIGIYNRALSPSQIQAIYDAGSLGKGNNVGNTDDGIAIAAPGNTVGGITTSAVQALTINGASGTFTLTFNGQTTALLPFNANAAEIQAALNALPSIGGVGGSVSVNRSGNVSTITFGGSLAYATLPALVVMGQSGASGSVVIVSQGALARNVISGNTGDGIDLTGSGATGNVVEGDYVGTNAAGTTALANGANGILDSAGGNTIGGTAAAARNVIGGNAGDGIDLTGSGATGNVVAGNFIGTDVTGSAALANGSNGVEVNGASGNTIGGVATGVQNVLAAGASLGGVYGVAVAANGDLIVPDDGNDRLLSINPVTGAQTVISSGGDFVHPDGVAVAADGDIYVADPGNFGADAGEIIRVNASTGAQTIVTSGGYLAEPTDLAIGPNGFLYVADDYAFDGNGAIIEVNPTTTPGSQTVVTEGNGTSLPGELAFDAQGDLLAVYGPLAGGTGEVDRVNLTTGARTAISSGGLIVNPVGLVIESDGSLLVANLSNAAGTGPGDIIRIDPTTGAQSVAYSGGTLFVPTELAVAANGDLYVTNYADDTFNHPQVVRIAANAARNVISGNTGDGIDITGSGATGNLVEGNYLGTNAAGTAALGNATGVDIDNGAVNNTVGGTSAGAGNLISGNAYGVAFSNAGSGNVALGNLIGTDATGSTAIGNGFGIAVGFSTGETIGGTTAGARNVISGNGYGINIDVTFGLVIQGNWIGLNAAGTAAVPNAVYGIQDAGPIPAENVLIGGTTPGAGNVISGNNGPGILSGAQTTVNFLIQGNLIGTNPAGTAALDSSNQIGVQIQTDGGTTVGGTTPAARNIISGNLYGINIQSTSAIGNAVEGNYIGTDITGTVAVGNGLGVTVNEGASNNTIGGTASGAGNLISGNNTGVAIAYSGTSGNVVEGNLIGTDRTGATALANDEGVVITGGATNNIIGGTTSGAGNVISGNSGDGVAISNNAAFGNGITTGNVLEGNYIGTNNAGTNLGNHGAGVSISGGAANNTIGGTAPGMANTIAFNSVDGVAIDGAGTTGNPVRGNSIYDNAGLGIHLTNGGDNNQAYPVLSSFGAGLPTTVSGVLTVPTAPDATFTLDFYADSGPAAGAFGQGQVYLGSLVVVTDASGNAPFTATLPASTSPGQVVSVTATDAAGDTSQFAADVGIANYHNTNPGVTLNGPANVVVGTPASLTSTLSDTTTGKTYTYAWSVTEPANPSFALPSDAITDEPSLVFVPPTPGSYVADLLVTDNLGGSSTASLTLTARVPGPGVVIKGAPGAPIAANTTVNLTSVVAEPTGAAPTSYAWSVTVNNGQLPPAGSFTSSNPTPSSLTFTPNVNNLYEIGLTVLDSAGGASSTSVYVLVTGATTAPSPPAPPAPVQTPPTATITSAPPSALVGHAVTLTGTGSAGTTLTWSVALNGQPYPPSPAQPAQGSGTSFTFTPTQTGAYVVTLTATNAAGQEGSVIAKVVVNPAVVPVILSAVHAPFEAPFPAQVDATVTTPVSGVNYSFTWTVTGTVHQHPSYSVTQLSPSSSAFTLTSPTSPDSYTVSVAVTGSDGSTGTTSQVISVAPPLTAAITQPGGAVTSGPLGVPVNFAARVGGGAGSVSYSWSVTLNDSPYSLPHGTVTNAPTFSFTPTQFGPYAVILTATDSAGGSATAADSFMAVPAIVYTGATVSTDGTTFTASLTTDVPATGSFTYEWLLNANLVQQLGTPAVSIAGNTGTQYTVTLTVFDSSSNTVGTASQTLDFAPAGVTVDDSAMTTPVLLVAVGGHDKLMGGQGPSVLMGDTGNNTLIGGSGPDTLIGTGSDTLMGGTGPSNLFQISQISGEQVTAGTQNNTLSFARAGSGVTVSLGGRTQSATTSGGTVSLTGAFQAVMGSATGNNKLSVTKGSGLTLFGGSGNDSLSSSGGSSITLVGGSGNETLSSSGGSSITLFGGSGNDTLMSSGGSSISIVGGSGNDTLMSSGGSSITLFGGTGNDSLSSSGGSSISIVAGSGNDTLSSSGTGASSITLFGGSGNDSLSSSGGTNITLVGGSGNETLSSSGGSSITLFGGSGNDTLMSSGGSSISIVAGSGNDTLSSSGGSSITMFGGSGNDSLSSSGGSTITMVGGSGNETLSSSGGSSVTMFGGSGNDSLMSSGGSSISIVGGSGNDTLSSSGGSSITMFGGTGNDTLMSSGGTSVTMVGGTGNDSLSSSGGSGIVVAASNQAPSVTSLTDMLSSSGGSYIFTATVSGNPPATGTPTGSVDFIDTNPTTGTSTDLGSATLSSGSATLTEPSSMVAGNTITATYSGDGSFATSSAAQILGAVPTTTVLTSSVSGANVVFTATVSADAGSVTPAGSVDFFDATTNTDLGSVTLVSGSASSVPVSAASVAGHRMTATYMPATASGFSASSASQTLIGNDTLSSSGGTSVTMFGGSGNDSLNSSGGSTISMVAGSGNDTLSSSGGSSITMFGGSGNDSLSSSGGSNITLVGGSGNETLSSSGGSSITLFGGSGNDTLMSSGGSSISIVAGSGNDTLSSSGGSSITMFGGSGNDSLSSSGGSNITLVGGSGNETLSSSGGSSITMFGGSGNDTLMSSGGSSISIVAGSGNDTLSSSGGSSVTMFGGTGNDSLSSSGGSNITLVGGSGNETLSSSGGSSITLFGGSGNDTLMSSGGSSISIVGGSGNDTLSSSGGSSITLFGGSGNDSLSSSGGTSVGIAGSNQVPSVTSLTDTVAGNSYTFTATISGNPQPTGTPTGFVDFIDTNPTTGTSTDLGRVILGSGSATLTTSAVSAGNIITATYSGDGNFATSSAAQTLASSTVLTTTVLTSSTTGANVVFTATVSADTGGSAPTGGSVDFKDATTGADLGSFPLVGGSATSGAVSAASLAGHRITATYFTASGFSVSSASQSLIGNSTLSSSHGTSVTMFGGTGNDSLNSSGGSSVTIIGGSGNDTLSNTGGSSVTLFGGTGNDSLSSSGGSSVSVVGGYGNDTLSSSGGSSITLFGGTGNDSLMSSGGSSVTIFGGTGNDTLTSSGGSSVSMFGGTGNDSLSATHGGSEGAQVIGGAATTTKLTSTTDATGHTTLTATVSADAGSATPTGSVDFFDQTTKQDLTPGGVMLVHGVATFTAGTASVAGHSVIATYASGGGFTGSSGTQTLDARPVTTALTSTTDATGNTTLTATVSYDAGTDTPTGAVDFFDQTTGTDLGSAPLVKGIAVSAVLPTASVSVAAGDSIEAIYDPAANVTMIGGTGNDTLSSTGGSSITLFGGSGNDSLSSSGGSSITITGGSGNDTLSSTGGSSVTLQGGSGNDSLNSSGGSSITMFGGTGNDTLTANGGAGVGLYGQEGNNLYNIIGPITVALNDLDTFGQSDQQDDSLTVGINTIAFPGLSNLTPGQPGIHIDLSNTSPGPMPQLPTDPGQPQTVAPGIVVSLTGQFQDVIGTPGDDWIHGNASTNVFDGGGGNDTLIGGTGPATLIAGSGNDLLTAGSGGTTFQFTRASTGADTIDPPAGTAQNVLDFSQFGAAVSLNLGSTSPQQVSPGASRLTLTLQPPVGQTVPDVNGYVTSGDGDQVTGNNRGDTFYVGAGNNTFTGGGGADSFVFSGSQLGTDTLDETSSGNTLNFRGFGGPVNLDLTQPAGTQTISQSAASSLALALSNPSAFDAVVGSAFGGTVVGNNDANETIIGGGGLDKLVAGNGSDNVQGYVTQVVYLDFPLAASSSTDQPSGNPGPTDTATSWSYNGGTYTATVTATGTRSRTPTGTVDFFDTAAKKDLGIAALVGGVATLAASTGGDPILATYSGENPAGDHVYTAAEENAVLQGLQADYADFNYFFTLDPSVAQQHAQVSGGQYVTIEFNAGTAGGASNVLDPSNLDLGGTTVVNVNPFLGAESAGLVPPTSANIIGLTTTIAAHELGHQSGLQHQDSFGPIGAGLFSGVNPDDFYPAYQEPQASTAATTTSLTSSGSGVSLSLTAVVSASSTPSGTVDFFDVTTGTDLGSVTLSSSGSATLAAPSVAASDTITATYSPSLSASQYLDSSAALAIATASTNGAGAKASTTTSLTDSVSADGTTFTFTVTVSASASSSSTPTGTVDFFDATTDTDLGSLPLTGGSVSGALSRAAVAGGSIVVTYSGDSTFAPSAASLSIDSAPETPFDIMASPASVGTTLLDAAGVYGPTYLGARDAIVLAFNDTGTVLQRPDLSTANPNLTVTDPSGLLPPGDTPFTINNAYQLGALPALAVPNTIPGSTADFAVTATAVNATLAANAIFSDGSPATTEEDFYAFTGQGGELMNFQVISNNDTLNPAPFDPELLLIGPSGQVVAYNQHEFESPDSTLLDVTLPGAQGVTATYYVGVDSLYHIPGNYQLFMYSYAPGAGPSFFSDTLVGGSGNDTLSGSSGNDLFVFPRGSMGNATLLGGSGSNTLDLSLAPGETIKQQVGNFNLIKPIVIPTTTSLATPANSSYGQALTLTAMVSPQYGGGGGTPTGTVDFFDTTTNTDLGTAALSVVDGVDEAVLTSTVRLHAGTYSITATYTPDSNSSQFLGSATSTPVNQVVTPATLTIAPAAGQSKLYGAAVPTLTYTASGFVNNDPTSTLTGLLGTQATASSPVGSYAFTLGSLSAGGNYTLTISASPPTFAVTPATLTVTANNATKVFDTPNPTFSDTITGFVNNDPASVVTGAASLTTNAATNSPVGTYTITAAPGTLSAANYTFAFVNGTLTITLAPSGGTSVIVLSTSAAASLSLSGNAEIGTVKNPLNGPVDVDSNSSSAISVSGNAQVNAGSIQVVGKVQSSGNAKLSPNPTSTGSFLDPLAGLPVPSVSGSASSVSVSGNSSLTISQGVYSAISVSGNGKLTMNPGVYVIAGGGFSVTGNGSVSGSGVMIYNAGSKYTAAGGTGGTFGVVTLSGNGNISLTAPTTGAYTSILIFQSRDNTSPVSLSGNGIVMPGGVIYAPAAPLTITGSGQFDGSLVVNTLTISGNSIAQLSTGSDDATVYAPAQIRDAYGINNLSLDGTGQTIAIVDAYDNPDIYQSVDAFDAQFSPTDSGTTLDQLYGPASSFLTMLNQQGQTTSLPETDPVGAGTDNWEVEEALDVEWTHAVAPGAQIVLVEADSQSLADLMTAVATAAQQPGVSVVSMSWGFPEGQTVLARDEATYDPYFTTPAGHTGVTFVASTGDYAASVLEYPAVSPNVLAVGGTSLTLNADNSYNSEVGWGYYSDALGLFLGSGGGVSQYESEPGYQQGVQSTGSRTTPDVSFLADPDTGVWVADSYNLGSDNPWEVVGGTSLSAPAWAGLIALADQGRVAAGEATLGTAGPTEAQTALYGLSQADYHAVTSGNNGYSAGPGYNLVTGLGSPVADLLIPDLIAYSGGPASATPVTPITAADLVPGSGVGNGGGAVEALVQAGALRVFTAVTAPGLGNGSNSIPLVAAAFPAGVARPTTVLAADGTGAGQGTASGAGSRVAIPAGLSLNLGGVDLAGVAPSAADSTALVGWRSNEPASDANAAPAWSPILLDVSPAIGLLPGTATGALSPEMPADSSSDVLVGGGGDDLLVGGAGRNLLVGGYAAGPGATVSDGLPDSRYAALDALMAGGWTAEAIGSRFSDDYFLGNGGDSGAGVDAREETSPPSSDVGDGL